MIKKLVLAGFAVFLVLSLCTNLMAAKNEGSDLLPIPLDEAPCIENYTTWGSNINMTVTNWGYLGSGMDPNVIDPETGQPAPSCEFPSGSNLEYLFQGAIWIGAIVNGDTLVSCGTDGWWDTHEMFPDSCPDGEMRVFTDIADREIIGVFSDTNITFAEIDPIDQRPHRPIGVKITSHTYAWFERYYRDFVINRYTIENISDHPIHDIWIGIHYDGDVHHRANSGNGAQDDMNGLFTNEDYQYAWIIDNDGDPDNPNNPTAWTFESVRSVCGMLLLNPPEELNSSFNWWISNVNSQLDWGPQWIENYQGPFPGGGRGTPGGDAARYRVMSNGEHDYDQAYAAIDYSDGGPGGHDWIAPLPSDNARDLANGYDTRFQFSFGSFSLNPGETYNIDVAIVAGEDLHVNPSDYLDYFYGRETDTTAIREFYDHLYFTDLQLNIICALGRYHGGAPQIERTDSTLALHEQAWEPNTEFTIRAWIKDMDIDPHVESAQLYYRTSGTEDYTITSMTLYSEDVYSGIIPEEIAQPPGVDYYLSATDGEFEGTDPRVNPEGNPYTIAILPNLSPVIVHDTVLSFEVGSPIPVTAEIFDNTNYVESAKLFYRIPRFWEYYVVEMVNTSGDTYYAEVPAEHTTSEGVDYYLFAVDDFGSETFCGYPEHPFWIEPEWINHPPETNLLTDFERTYYSYPYLTDYFSGLEVNWSATDSLDPHEPDLDYHWELMGPFTARPDSTFDDTSMIYSAYDSTLNSIVRWESFNEDNNDIWVRDTSTTIYNLRNGYYIFRVQARDDSLAEDTTYLWQDGSMKSVGILHAIQPYWNSEHDSALDILVVDHTYHDSPLPGNNGATDDYRSFHLQLLHESGIDTVNMISWRNCPRSTDTPEPEDIIKHRLLLLLNDDWTEEIGDSSINWYTRYLNVGGKIMVTGRQTFLRGRTNQMEPFTVYYGSNEGDVPGDNRSGRFARDYFNLYGSRFPGWYPFPGQNINLNQELTGAYAQHQDFPEITLDTVKVKNVVRGWYDTLEIYLPAVEYLMRNDDSETLLNFKSYRPENSEFDGFPIAVRYDTTMQVGEERRTAFQTSYFAFPLYYSEYNQAVDVINTMLEWYGIGLTGISDGADLIPKDYSLSQNYPNPFNPITTIRYALPENTHVKFDVFNVLGQRVENIVDENQTAGYKSIQWDASDYSSGIYFYRLATDDKTFTKRMTLLK
ncbi:MAG: T9SS type A sorting domain-containing protein [candidate division Zixibacteria bacterium]|nr:T9SS type A sorting domain-containing protein [candidate division Zixibacteria bacterium]